MADYGGAFQDVLEAMHTIYRARGDADIRYVGTQAHAYRPRQTGELTFMPEKSMPDFIGCIYRDDGDGAFVCFDAKTSASIGGWRLSRKAQHQQRTLAEFANVGGICFFIVEFRRRGICYLRRIYYSDRTLRAFVLPDVIANERGAQTLVVQPEGGVYDWLRCVRDYWLVSR